MDYSSELYFKTSRSGGKGGQNVNKVSSKVELNFNVNSSALLTWEQKQLIHQKLRNKINKDGILQIIVQSERSQLQNKKIAIQKFYDLIKNCFSVQKKRIATKVTKAAQKKRIEKKRKHSFQKALRKGPLI